MDVVLCEGPVDEDGVLFVEASPLFLELDCELDRMFGYGVGGQEPRASDLIDPRRVTAIDEHGVLRFIRKARYEDFATIRTGP